MDTSILLQLLKRQAVDQSNDANIGSTRTDDNAPDTSASGLVATLVPTLIIAAVFTTCFVLFRTKFPRQYAPRTFLGSLRQQEKTPALPGTRFGWLSAINQIPDTYVLQHNSIDGFFLLRYMKMGIIITFVGCLLTWPILFPVNATGGAGKVQLTQLSIANISNGYRYFAHCLLGIIFISFIFFLVTRELLFYISLRQAYLLSPLYAERISSRTVLFQSVPTEYCDEAKIKKMFGDKLKNVWIASDAEELTKMVDERTKAAMKLEVAETKLIKLANQNRIKAEKKDGPVPVDTRDTETGGESGSVAARWVSPKKRPTHRLKPLIGKKVDTINWARDEIARLNPLIEAEQTKYRNHQAKPLNGVFVEFFNQTEAQAAYQMVAHHMPLHMSPRVVGMKPEEIVWKNLGITWKTRTIRNIISITLVVVTIIFWSIPVAVVGAISNINFLTSKVKFLSFINNCPSWLLGVITKLLPTIMLAVLMALLPIYLRFMGRFAGKATNSLVELRCHESYFWFQVIQVFLVTTFTSAASATVTKIIDNPSSVTSLLAENLPQSSNFYISYFILQGLTFASGALLQIAGLVVFQLLGKILDSTPRKMYNRWANLSSLGWGTVFPIIELMVVISITYSVIAPLMMGFATVGLFLFYFAYRYNLLFVNTANVDTTGLVYAKALKHTLVGCYLCAVCMIGLFAIKSADGGVGPLIIMIIFLIFMILYHISLNSAVEPLLNYLPRSLESEEDSLARAESGLTNGDVHEKAIIEKTSTSVSLGKNNGKPPSMIQKFLRPDRYANYYVMRRLVNRDFADITYSPEVERDAYQHPAALDVTPLLWVPRDTMGVSRQECAHTNKVTPMTDDGAWLDDKGKIVWDQEGTNGNPPIYEPPVYY